MQEVKAIGADAVHVCVDMQRLFAGETDWHTPSIPEILPNILRLPATRRSARSLPGSRRPNMPKTRWGTGRPITGAGRA